MFYATADKGHGLPRDPFKMCVIPRPIGWISTVARDGTVNLAPYSYFNAVATDPPMVMFANGGASQARGPGSLKDSATNAVETGEFVVNLATWAQREALNRSSASVPPEVDEFALAGLEPLPARLIKPPRVKGAPVHLECRTWQAVELPADATGARNVMVVGEVVGIHIDDACLTDGRLDPLKMKPIARLGYMDYSVVERVFTMDRPKPEAGNQPTTPRPDAPAVAE